MYYCRDILYHRLYTENKSISAEKDIIKCKCFVSTKIWFLSKNLLKIDFHGSSTSVLSLE